MLNFIYKKKAGHDAPDITPIRSPRPARIPTTPICPSGFWSNHSVTNSRAYCNIRSNRVGRMSLSIIAAERSRMSTRCRIMVRRIAAAGARSLPFVLGTCHVEQRIRHLRLLPRANRSSTDVCRLPASSSCTVSHERVNEASQVYACYAAR